MLIAEQFFLLATSPSGEVATRGFRKQGVFGAIVADLVLAGRLSISEGKNPKLVVEDERPLGCSAHDAVLAHLVAKGPVTMAKVWSARVNVEHEIGAGLQQAGIVGYAGPRFLGLKPERFPEIDPTPEARLRERIRGVLHGFVSPEDSDIVLLSLLHALRSVQRVLPAEVHPMSKQELKRTIEGLVADERLGAALRRALDAQAATIAATGAAAAVVATSS